MQTDKYAVVGYDKDNDFKETMFETTVEKMGVLIAKTLAKWQADPKKEQLRSSAGDPYDWFCLCFNSEPVKIFTPDNPNGRNMDQS